MLRFVISAGLCFVLSLSVIASEPTHAADSTHVQPKRVATHHRLGTLNTASAQTRVDVYNGSKAQTQVFDAEPAPGTKKNTKPAPALTRVDVINGSKKQMQTFSVEPATSPVSKGRAQRNVAEARLSDVEIFNGTTKQRRVFKTDGGGQSVPAPVHRNTSPVVVGIATSGAGPKEKSGSGVVTGIDSGRSAPTQSAVPVAVGVAPQPPKRPPYIPAPEQ